MVIDIIEVVVLGLVGLFGSCMGVYSIASKRPIGQTIAWLGCGLGFIAVTIVFAIWRF